MKDMMMKLGFQTIVFGRIIEDLDYLLASIADQGFTGVEFFQHHEQIFVHDGEDRFHPITIEDLIEKLRKYQLALLGLCGGTVKERISFCLKQDGARQEQLGIGPEDCRPLYLYTQDLDIDTILYAAQYDFMLAFHPHAFTKFERVEKSMQDFNAAAARLKAEGYTPGRHLRWLPDTAHMSVVGEDPIATLGSIPIDDIVAIHLKDYDPAYGRSYHRYAKGFVALGAGRVPIKQIITTTEGRGYQGWYVAEQDFSHTDPHTSMGKSAAWLVDKRYMALPASRFLTPDSVPAKRPTPVHIEHQQLKLYQFIMELHRAGETNLKQCYLDVARAIYHWSDASHVTLWSYGASRDDVCLLTSYPPSLQTLDENGNAIHLPLKVDIRTSPLGAACCPSHVAEMEISSFNQANNNTNNNANNQAKATVFSYASVARTTGAKSAVAISIPNRYNPNAARLLIGLLHREPGLVDYSIIVEQVADDISCALNAALDDACAVATGEVSLIADQKSTLTSFLAKLGLLIRRELDCAAVTIFLKNRTGDRLECRWGPELEWQKGLEEHERCYHKHETQHPTVQCWQECRTILLASCVDQLFNGDIRKPKSRERVPNDCEDHDDILLVPLVASAMSEDGILSSFVIGVVRCRNKQPVYLPDGEACCPYFTYDDAAILSTVCQAAVPHIDTLLRDEGLSKTISNMTHELNMPVNTLRAAVDRVETFVRRKEYWRLTDIAEDMKSWTGLMGRIIAMADLFGKKDRLLEPDCTRVRLMADVIAPLKPVMRTLLDDRRFDVEQIQYGDIDSLPALYLDRNQFQMVFFNLFSNAIKYAYSDPRQFNIEIAAEYDAASGEYRIHFMDDGPGILPEFKESIFDYGIRGPASMNQLVKGMGLGLWVVRRVVEAHEGRVEVTRSSDPTTITIFLPASRRSSPPRVNKKPRT